MTNDTKLIEAVEKADSAPKLIAAVKALADAKLESCIPTLIKVLGYNNPGAAVTAVNGLIALGDIAVKPLIEQLDGYNYGARAYTIRALAAIAHPAGLDCLLQSASDFAPSVRRAAAKGLGKMRWELLSAEKIPEAQNQVINTLLQTYQDQDWSIRYAVIVGLDELAKNGLSKQILTHLQSLSSQETDLAVSARLQLAISSF
jgi:phycocyanobilin lyase subunit beta